MQLEDYFEFETHQTAHGPVEGIRIKGHRIELELIVSLYKEGYSPERIHHTYRSLSLEQVYAAITYYLANKEAVERYVQRVQEVGDAYYRDWVQQEPPEVVQRLRALKARQQAEQPAS